MARRSDHTREELRDMALKAATKRVSRDGLKSLTARGIAHDIGYTPGTIYNVFENLDDLVRQMNGRTLDRLYEALTSAPIPAVPEKALRELAIRFIEFVERNPNLWSAIVDYSPQTTNAAPSWYLDKVSHLLGLAETAIARFFPARTDEARRHHARVLWSALYGVSSLRQSDNLPERDDALALIDTLITTYLRGLRVGNTGTQRQERRRSATSSS